MSNFQPLLPSDRPQRPPFEPGPRGPRPRWEPRFGPRYEFGPRPRGRGRFPGPRGQNPRSYADQTTPKLPPVTKENELQKTKKRKKVVEVTESQPPEKATAGPQPLMNQLIDPAIVYEGNQIPVSVPNSAAPELMPIPSQGMPNDPHFIPQLYPQQIPQGYPQLLPTIHPFIRPPFNNGGLPFYTPIYPPPSLPSNVVSLGLPANPSLEYFQEPIQQNFPPQGQFQGQLAPPPDAQQSEPPPPGEPAPPPEQPCAPPEALQESVTESDTADPAIKGLASIYQKLAPGQWESILNSVQAIAYDPATPSTVLEGKNRALWKTDKGPSIDTLVFHISYYGDLDVHYRDVVRVALLPHLYTVRGLVNSIRGTAYSTLLDIVYWAYARRLCTVPGMPEYLAKNRRILLKESAFLVLTLPSVQGGEMCLEQGIDQPELVVIEHTAAGQNQLKVLVKLRAAPKKLRTTNLPQIKAKLREVFQHQGVPAQNLYPHLGQG